MTSASSKWPERSAASNLRCRRALPPRNRIIAIVVFLFVLIGLTGVHSLATEFENVRVQLLNGSSIRCSIESIDEDGNVGGPNVPNDLRLDQIVKLITDHDRSSYSNENLQLKIIGGGTLAIAGLGVKDEQVTFQSLTGIESLKLELVRGVVWHETPRVRDALDNPSPDNDRVIVQTENGERIVDGILEGIDGTHVSINFRGESRRISLAIVNAVVNADLGLKPPEGASADIEISDGSMIRARIVQFAAGVLTLELPGRNQLRLKSAGVTGFSIESDKLVYLSDLDPISVQEKALFAAQRSWQRDRSIKGGKLTLGFSTSAQNSATFDKGLGMQPYTRLVFANENEFDRFRAIVGIDAETNGRGDCVMSVDGDGVRLWSQRIRATDDPVAVSVDISGMKRVALVVEAGEQFDLGDHADWGLARFTKSN